MRSPLQICAGALWPLAVVTEEMQLEYARAVTHRSNRTNLMVSAVSNEGGKEWRRIYCREDDDAVRPLLITPNTMLINACIRWKIKYP
jgi:hypothetical protein